MGLQRRGEIALRHEHTRCLSGAGWAFYEYTL
jgi:hypothetical protein